MSHAGTLRSRWIVSREFDLSLFFGGAALSLLVLVLTLVLRAPIVALWWIWLLAFDGPHIGAAFTRTYLDRQEWTRRPGMLAGSLADVRDRTARRWLLGVVTGSAGPFLLFLGFATLYGYYHVVRQHYGIRVALQRASTDWDAIASRWTARRSTLCLGSWLPYAYFLLSHPRARDAGRFVRDPTSIDTLGARCSAVWLAVWVARSSDSRAFHLRRRSFAQPEVAVSRSSPCYCTASSTSAICALRAGLRRVDRVPIRTSSCSRSSIVIFHNVQYSGWSGSTTATATRESTGHGLAQRRQSVAGILPWRVRAVLGGHLSRRSPARPACFPAAVVQWPSVSGP